MEAIKATWQKLRLTLGMNTILTAPVLTEDKSFYGGKAHIPLKKYSDTVKNFTDANLNYELEYFKTRGEIIMAEIERRKMSQIEIILADEAEVILTGSVLLGDPSTGWPDCVEDLKVMVYGVDITKDITLAHFKHFQERFLEKFKRGEHD